MTTAKNFPSDYPSHIPPKEAIELNCGVVTIFA